MTYVDFFFLVTKVDRPDASFPEDKVESTDGFFNGGENLGVFLVDQMVFSKCRLSFVEAGRYMLLSFFLHTLAFLPFLSPDPKIKLFGKLIMFLELFRRNRFFFLEKSNLNCLNVPT